jgi:hypothetical protein
VVTELWVALLLALLALAVVPPLVRWALDRAYRRALDKHRRAIAQQVWDAHYNRKEPPA